MSDLDTRQKRASSVGILLAFVLAPPLPDATISQGDRQHIAWSYAGILAEAPAPVAPGYGSISQHPFMHSPSRPPSEIHQGHQPMPRLTFGRGRM